MARMRTVKPGFWKDGDLATIPRDARLFYIALWNFTDEEARVKGDPRYLKAECFPLDADVTPEVINLWIDYLESLGDVRRYSANGKPYLHLPNLGNHQSLRPASTPSSLPAPPDSGSEQGVLNFTNNSEKISNVRASRAHLNQLTDTGPDTGTGGVGGDEVDALCQELADQVTANGCKRPPVTQEWRQQARALLVADERPFAEVLDIIRYAQSDPFWRGKTMRMAKLREHYDQVRLQLLDSVTPRARAPSRNQRVIDVAVTALKEAQSNGRHA